MTDERILLTPKQAGFSLLEVLIAVLVIAIGLLGMAALQLKTVQNSHSAFQRTLASIVAMDAAERLWINLGDTPAKTAATIQSEWLTNWTGVLPAAATASSIENVASGKWRISVRWQENRIAGTNGVETFVYEMDLYP